MSLKENDIWLENKKEEFDCLMNSDAVTLEDIENAYQIIIEVEANGFNKEAIIMEDEWSEITKEVAPNYYKDFKNQND